MADLSIKQGIGWALAVMVLVVSGSMLGFWGYYYLVLGVELKNQQILLYLPPQLAGRVEKTGQLKLQVHGPVAVKVPLDQVITVPLKGNFPTRIKLDMPIPLNFEVPFKAILPINSSVDIETTTAAILPHLPEMPLKIRVPLQFEVPIDTMIPVRTRFRFYYEGPLDIQFDQQLKTPIKTVLHSTVPMHHNMQIPPLGAFDVRIYPQQAPVALHLHSPIRVPLTQLQLSADQP